jgi:hypothetical protein
MEETIIIDNIEVWPNDLGEMPWEEAMDKVAKLGPGWRLPTIEEFKEVLYPNRNNLPGYISFAHYWSNAELDYTTARTFQFTYGYASNYTKSNPYYACAVRDYSIEIIVTDLLKEF